MDISLIIPYRNRYKHFEIFKEWFTQNKLFNHIETIFVESSEEPTLKLKLDFPNHIYHHVPEANNSLFHLAKYLNTGLASASGKIVCAYDIDLIPARNSLNIHINRALSNHDLICGYRLNIKDINLVQNEYGDVEVCKEDMPSALLKNLITKEKFGVCPFFQKKKLEEINGWNEIYVGWGAEDQDLIERYLKYTDGIILRSPNILYYHLTHDYEIFWKSQEIIDRNRQLYYKKDSGG